LLPLVCGQPGVIPRNTANAHMRKACISEVDSILKGFAPRK
jgi:hypothetical protein